MAVRSANCQRRLSTCAGAPFLPLHPSIYAEMLGERIEAQRKFILSTRAGRAASTARRASIKHTRAMVTAALSGERKMAGGLTRIQCSGSQAVNGVPVKCKSARDVGRQERIR